MTHRLCTLLGKIRWSRFSEATMADSTACSAPTPPHCDAKSREVASVLVRCLFALLLLPPRALAQAQTTQPPSDLSQASIEQLMDIEVTSVSKKQQKLSRAAAAIYVITQDEIRRSGSTNIPDLLRIGSGG